jgi:hypothetical protein
MVLEFVLWETTMELRYVPVGTDGDHTSVSDICRLLQKQGVAPVSLEWILCEEGRISLPDGVAMDHVLYEEDLDPDRLCLGTSGYVVAAMDIRS